MPAIANVYQCGVPCPADTHNLGLTTASLRVVNGLLGQEQLFDFQVIARESLVLCRITAGRPDQGDGKLAGEFSMFSSLCPDSSAPRDAPSRDSCVERPKLPFLLIDGLAPVGKSPEHLNISSTLSFSNSDPDEQTLRLKDRTDGNSTRHGASDLPRGSPHSSVGRR